MLDPTTRAVYNAATTPVARAQAVRDSLGTNLTVEVRDGETLVYSGTFTGPMTAGGDGSLSADVLLSGLVGTAGTPNAATWTCRIRNADGRYIEGSFGPGGRFTFSGGALVVGQAVRLRVTIAAAGGWPVWRRGMAPRTWAEVPTADTLSDINPRNNPAVNPNYPGSPEWNAVSGQSQIISAWCGGCYDELSDTLWLPLGGGHSDYAGNEPYRITLNADTPAFEMVRPPSGAIGNLLMTNDGQESSGVYADGRPRAIHSYNKPVFVPGTGPFIAVQGNCSWSGQAGTTRAIRINGLTGEATMLAANPFAGASSGGGSCYDPTRHAIWWRHAGTGGFSRYSVADDSWSSVGASKAVSGYSALCYLPDHDCILWANNGLTNGFAVLDCAAATLHEPDLIGSPVGATIRGHTQPRWVSSLGGAAFWDNASDTTIINVLTPGANPRTDAWTASQLSVSEGNAVTPTSRTTNGTYGRFVYSPKLNGFFVLNATNQRPYFFAL